MRRFPIGVVSMVSPFNFPLNLAAHKIAPAIAAGCPFVLKPASKTPIGALMIAEVLAECPDMPKGACSVITCDRKVVPFLALPLTLAPSPNPNANPHPHPNPNPNDDDNPHPHPNPNPNANPNPNPYPNRKVGDIFVCDERLKLLSFTGSPSVGWDMKARCGKKKVVLELGGNAACVVDSWDEATLPLDKIVERICFGAFYQSGQSCIHLQRLLVRQDHYDKVVSALVDKTKQLKKGNPLQPDCFVGPLISEGIREIYGRSRGDIGPLISEADAIRPTLTLTLTLALTLALSLSLTLALA